MQVNLQQRIVDSWPLSRILRRRNFKNVTTTATKGELPLPVSRRHRFVRVATIAMTVVVVCIYLDQFTLGLYRLEQQAFGARLHCDARLNGQWANRARQHIALVTITDETFQHGNFKKLSDRPRPVPRQYHAKLVRALTEVGAKVIAFDLLFDRPLPGEKPLPGDPEFATAARASGKVLWACQFEEISRQTLTLPTIRLREASPHYGHVNVPYSEELPAIDRAEPVIKYKGEHIPAFSLEAVRMASGLGNQPLDFTSTSLKCGNINIPVDDSVYAGGPCFIIRYLGAPYDPAAEDNVFTPEPYEDIYAWIVDEKHHPRGLADHPYYQDYFRDKIVLIGDTTETGRDRWLTPLGEMSGVEINAHAIATLLQGRFIREAPQWINTAVIFLMVALVCPLTMNWRLRSAALAMLLLLPTYCLLNTWLLVDHGILLHLVAPSAAMMLATIGVLIERGLSEEWEKTRMRRLLQSYVSPQIAEYVINHPEKCILGDAGESVIGTVLFSDIREFTSLTEQLTQEELVTRLNEYFQAMTDVAFKHGGTVARFVGDAMMILFGIPVPYPDHARRAVAVAIDMQKVLRELQEQWRTRGLSSFDIGIGINTGEMVAGNVGARQRMDFTVHGPAVNLASRVESLNKEQQSRILITECTYQFVKDEVDVRGPVTSYIKGVAEAVVIYEVYGWRPVTDDPPQTDTAASSDGTSI